MPKKPLKFVPITEMEVGKIYVDASNKLIGPVTMYYADYANTSKRFQGADKKVRYWADGTAWDDRKRGAPVEKKKIVGLYIPEEK